MAEYIPTPIGWVREQVELYESSGGTKGTTLRDTGLPCVLVTHTGNKTGAIRKTPLMKVKDKESYVLVGSQGGAPKNPQRVMNLRSNDKVELRDATEKEADEFFESLTSDQFQKIRDFFESMPKLSHEVKFKCTGCEKENVRTLEGMASFFG